MNSDEHGFDDDEDFDSVSCAGRKPASNQEKRKSSSSSAKEDSAFKSWACKFCTFVNEPSVDICDVCAKSNPRKLQRMRTGSKAEDAVKSKTLEPANRKAPVESIVVVEQIKPEAPVPRAADLGLDIDDEMIKEQLAIEAELKRRAENQKRIEAENAALDLASKRGETFVPSLEILEAEMLASAAEGMNPPARVDGPEVYVQKAVPVVKVFEKESVEVEEKVSEAKRLLDEKERELKEILELTARLAQHSLNAKADLEALQAAAVVNPVLNQAQSAEQSSPQTVALSSIASSPFGELMMIQSPIPCQSSALLNNASQQQMQQPSQASSSWQPPNNLVANQVPHHKIAPGDLNQQQLPNSSSTSASSLLSHLNHQQQYQQLANDYFQTQQLNQPNQQLNHYHQQQQQQHHHELLSPAPQIQIPSPQHHFQFNPISQPPVYSSHQQQQNFGNHNNGGLIYSQATSPPAVSYQQQQEAAQQYNQQRYNHQQNEAATYGGHLEDHGILNQKQSHEQQPQQFNNSQFQNRGAPTQQTNLPSASANFGSISRLDRSGHAFKTLHGSNQSLNFGPNAQIDASGLVRNGLPTERMPLRSSNRFMSLGDLRGAAASGSSGNGLSSAFQAKIAQPTPLYPPNSEYGQMMTGFEVIKMIREAEQRGYSPDDVEVALAFSPTQPLGL